MSFVGRLPRAEIPSAIASFDLCYSGYRPTRSGAMYGAPLKLYEYMAMGKPVIASRNPDSDNLVTDDSTGFSFVAGDKESLKHALGRAMERKDAIPGMGSQARTVIEQHHSWKKRVETLIEKLEPIIGTNSVRPGDA